MSNREGFGKQVDIPLAVEGDGVLRVVGKAVDFETIAGAFEDGTPAEEIVGRHPGLTLDEVFLVLTYYLRHRREVEQYLSGGAYAAA